MHLQVVNLLIEMARSACKSGRKETIFDPFPTVVHPVQPTEFALHPKKVKTKYTGTCSWNVINTAHKSFSLFSVVKCCSHTTN